MDREQVIDLLLFYGFKKQLDSRNIYDYGDHEDYNYAVVQVSSLILVGVLPDVYHNIMDLTVPELSHIIEEYIQLISEK